MKVRRRGENLHWQTYLYARDVKITTHARSQIRLHASTKYWLDIQERLLHQADCQGDHQEKRLRRSGLLPASTKAGNR